MTTLGKDWRQKIKYKAKLTTSGSSIWIMPPFPWGNLVHWWTCYVRQAGWPNIDKLDCGENAKYMSYQAAEEFQDTSAKVISKEIEREIQQSQFVSVLVDENKDISVTQKLVYIRFMTEKFVPTTCFVKNPDLSDGKATTILNCLKAIQKVNRLAPPVLSKVFWWGSDGASVRRDHKGGVSVLMIKENPMLANVHCLAHQLALCTSQVASDIVKLKNYQQIITDIYCYFSKSAKHSESLKKVQEVLESDVLKIKEVHSVHWFSFYNALYAIYHLWGALVTYFVSQAESDAKVKGFLKKITEYVFIGITHFLIYKINNKITYRVLCPLIAQSSVQKYG